MIKIKQHNYLRKKLANLLISKRFWIGITLFIIALLFTLSPLKIIFNPNFLVNFFQANSSFAVPLFIIAYIILSVISIPGTILTLVGGIIFGLLWGTIWSVIGATLGALGAFWTARYLLRDLVKQKFAHHQTFITFNQGITHQPIAFVLAVRFVPISPFNLVNFVLGLTPIHWFPYTLGTFVGIIPGTLAYTWLGVSGIEALQGSDRLSFFLALSFLGLLSILPLLAKKKSI
ncbi:SNARE associated Golgi protein [Gloeothece citriformis PCC 7424]|uniref:TVP38/TMEM64 family membrane protein n=1 Tax=Gloeothece citriformis (strain PCC 7424) TaxID=65393 RepID=B7KHF7_GLOC7|nr:TVP38/TMEM64 family protein [Gloeothece citriformis]ACK70652.1 SNARE associated Golgi protein [Gloeothece citriformis PCC 7424]